MNDADGMGVAATSTPGRGVREPWEPIGRVSTHELVIEAIENQIVAGELVLGDVLPPERDLAAQLQVSRTVVREAIRVLEAHGVLDSRTGSGPSAGTQVVAQEIRVLTRFIRLHRALAGYTAADLTEVLQGLETTSGRLASALAHAIREALDTNHQQRSGRTTRQRIDQSRRTKEQNTMPSERTPPEAAAATGRSDTSAESAHDDGRASRQGQNPEGSAAS